MSRIVFLDTHVVVWLFDKLSKNFSKRALATIESNELCVSPVVHLELEHLFEIDRIRNGSAEILEYLEKQIQLKIDDKISTKQWFATSSAEKWTRDPFDRLIVSHAKMRRASLVSKDAKIQKHYEATIW
jgi:PIN domain nuclease of toxin-antitoxin system